MEIPPINDLPTTLSTTAIQANFLPPQNSLHDQTWLYYQTSFVAPKQYADSVIYLYNDEIESKCVKK
jgi:hypothetical protein